MNTSPSLAASVLLAGALVSLPGCLEMDDSACAPADGQLSCTPPALHLANATTYIAANGTATVRWSIVGDKQPAIDEIHIGVSAADVVTTVVSTRTATVNSGRVGNYSLRVAVPTLDLAATGNLVVDVPTRVGLPAATAYAIENPEVTFDFANSAGQQLVDETLQVRGASVPVNQAGAFAAFGITTVGTYAFELYANSLSSPVAQILTVVDHVDRVVATNTLLNDVCFEGKIGATTVRGIPWIVSASGNHEARTLGNGCYSFDYTATNVVVTAGYHGVSTTIILNPQS